MKYGKAARIIFWTLILTLPSGCATQTYRYAHTPTESDGIVVVYRRFAFNASVLPAIIEVNGQDVGSLNTGEYVLIRVSPGTHTVAVRGQGISQEEVNEITIKETEKLYVQVMPNPARMWMAIPAGLLGPFAGYSLEQWFEIRMFLLRESSEEEFTSVIDNMDEKRIEYVPPDRQSDSSDQTTRSEH